MNKGEPFSFLRGTLKQLKKLNLRVNQIIDGINNDELYLIDFKDVEQKYNQMIDNYKDHSELIDIDEFAINYVYGYHTSNNLLERMESKQAMYLEVKEYLESNKELFKS